MEDEYKYVDINGTICGYPFAVTVRLTREDIESYAISLDDLGGVNFRRFLLDDFVFRPRLVGPFERVV